MHDPWYGPPIAHPRVEDLYCLQSSFTCTQQLLLNNNWAVYNAWATVETNVRENHLFTVPHIVLESWQGKGMSRTENNKPKYAREVVLALPIKRDVAGSSSASCNRLILTRKILARIMWILSREAEGYPFEHNKSTLSKKLETFPSAQSCTWVGDVLKQNSLW